MVGIIKVLTLLMEKQIHGLMVATFTTAADAKIQQNSYKTVIVTAAI